ncbi:hypothetical protein [Sphingomonas faeni]|uniref:hypothetical protein n=1 Tax=Sphingomonas faeni TaxID=185950 RepID=UPI0033598F8B
MLIFLAIIAAQTPPPSNCRYDKPAMMALDERAFDQTMTGGWRTLANAGCDAQAADLIAEWRAGHPANPRTAGLLQWHEGQLRANAGQTARAITLFEAARKPAEEMPGSAGTSMSTAASPSSAATLPDWIRRVASLPHFPTPPAMLRSVPTASRAPMRGR